MTRVILDSTVTAKLSNLTESVEICNASGEILGHFVPRFDPSRYEGIEPNISEEELDRREREGGGRTLAEIMADLEKRT